MQTKTLVIDIDGTICSITNGLYHEAIPSKRRIEKINQLFAEANIIIFYTARGMGSSKNDIGVAKAKWHDLTVSQLESWGVNYHHLFMGKPSGDVYVDDKAISDETFFETTLEELRTSTLWDKK
jgi:capsule biosynthesis phosphatase